MYPNLAGIYLKHAFSLSYLSFPADPEGPGCCALLLALVSILLIVATLPFSLCMCIKVRKEVGGFCVWEIVEGKGNFKKRENSTRLHLVDKL